MMFPGIERGQLLPSLSSDWTNREDASMEDAFITPRSVSPVSVLDDEDTLTPTSLSAATPTRKSPSVSTAPPVQLSVPSDPIGDLIKWWWIEIVACVIAVYTIGAQVCILLVYNNRPQDSWPSSILTLNSAIALLAIFCRGSIMVAVASCLSQSKWTRLSDSKSHRLSDYEMFDEASRGYWGSLQVLWKFHGVQ